MLSLIVEIIPERWDEKNEKFIAPKTVTLQLEHSLLSISKWEQKWHKPFLHTKELTYEESVDYIKCMTLNQNVKPEVYDFISEENVREIRAYIDDPMTASKFYDDEDKKGKKEIVTAELIYYWMIAQNIPFECRKWHLNTLLAQIRMCSINNAPPKKVSAAERARQYAKLNAERRAKLKSKG